MNLKYILIDIDGTLIDTKSHFYTSLQETLSHFGIYAELSNDLFGMSVIQALNALNISNTEDVKVFWETRFAELCQNAPFYPGILEAVQLLSERGIQLIVITSRSHCTADPLCQNSALAPFICGCIAAEDTILHKPHADPIIKALQQYEIDPRDTIYIGDGYHDYLASKSANVAFGFAGWNTDAENLHYPNVFLSPEDIVNTEWEKRIFYEPDQNQ